MRFSSAADERGAAEVAAYAQRIAETIDWLLRRDGH